MVNIKGISVLIAMSFLMLGCANINEGAIDYLIESKKLTGNQSDAGSVNATLVQKYAPKQNGSPIIEKGDTITVDLKQAFIKSFSERFSLFDLAGKSGEIAVVANVFEMGNEDGRNGINFGPQAVSSGRVVYYSGDVREKQFLNQSQIPIYGPIKYDGNRLVIQLFIVEIDAEENSQMSNILSTLAGFGSAAYPPASPVLKVLDTLGSSLVKANKNDVEFSYVMTLLPNEGSGYVEPAILTAGNYVFGRSEDRMNEVDWAALEYNQETGRLITKDKDGKDTVFRDQTYVVVQVDKGYDDISLELKQATLTELVDELNAEVASDATKMQALATDFANGFMRVRNKNDGRSLLRSIERGGMTANDAQSKSFELGKLISDAISSRNDDSIPNALEDADLEQILRKARALTDKAFDDNIATVEGLTKTVGGNKVADPAKVKLVVDALTASGALQAPGPAPLPAPAPAATPPKSVSPAPSTPPPGLTQPRAGTVQQ